MLYCPCVPELVILDNLACQYSCHLASCHSCRTLLQLIRCSKSSVQGHLGRYGKRRRPASPADGRSKNDTNQIVAIKLIDLESSDDDISEIQAEIAHLSTCDSDHITRYYGSFVRGYKLWIVMEYLAGGSCLDLVSGKGTR